ncbi:hypothetical protein SBA1_420016 [Candidatus Sulfotelmatobacter kueseliae]|uniref:Uncharacterized protein n=1 Tax=Candidatus Sulfotelmatobacter kueseliae TaxID=2042962 RepID=A0A2U3KR09_9BACT|nr:hypothetical protein SBA1_420016 [Candidatus Sulfotelmatobacter kueseliae]
MDPVAEDTEFQEVNAAVDGDREHLSKVEKFTLDRVRMVSSWLSPVRELWL